MSSYQGDVLRPGRSRVWALYELLRSFLNAHSSACIGKQVYFVAFLCLKEENLFRGPQNAIIASRSPLTVSSLGLALLSALLNRATTASLLSTDGIQISDFTTKICLSENDKTEEEVTISAWDFSGV